MNIGEAKIASYNNPIHISDHLSHTGYLVIYNITVIAPFIICDNVSFCMWPLCTIMVFSLISKANPAPFSSLFIAPETPKPMAR